MLFSQSLLHPKYSFIYQPMNRAHHDCYKSKGIVVSSCVAKALITQCVFSMLVLSPWEPLKHMPFETL